MSVVPLWGRKCPFGHKMGGRCSPEAALLRLGNNSRAECSPAEEKCPFGHKKGGRCSPEAALLRLGNNSGAECSPEAALLRLGNNSRAECSPAEEKCSFGHKMGGRCSPEAALLRLGNISGAECSAEVALPADWDTKKLPGFPGSFRYFLKYMLFIQFTIIADRNLHLKSFSHHHPLYKLFQLQGICP